MILAEKKNAHSRFTKKKIKYRDPLEFGKADQILVKIFQTCFESCILEFIRMFRRANSCPNVWIFD